MGGLLFHQARMPRDEYLQREQEVRAACESLYPGRFRIPRFYGNKKDFGDMDVIVADGPEWARVYPEICAGLGITETHRTGTAKLRSTLYRGLQTDFFPVPLHLLDATNNYMSFNDMGNFLGRIARRFDLKYGMDGLSYVYRRADNNYRAEHPITTDFGAICAFLGLDYAAWVRGFESREAIFKWVIESPYFSVAPYLDEGAGTMEVRKIGRETVKRFVEWLRENQIDKRPEYKSRREYLPFVIASFPDCGLEDWFENERRREAAAGAMGAKFSGQRVRDLVPTLQGAALGQVIRALRARTNWQSFVLEATQDEIDRVICEEAARLENGVGAL